MGWEVRSARGKGKGLPQSLRAFARVLCCNSSQELIDLAMEAAQNDGRLARRPFKDSSREIQAHEILLSRISQLIEEYSVSMKSLEPVAASVCKRFARRRQMALDLLTGELRVLESAHTWLNNYCATLSQHSTTNDDASMPPCSFSSSHTGGPCKFTQKCKQEIQKEASQRPERDQRNTTKPE